MDGDPVGGEPLPATGFAMGDAVIGLVLKKFNCLPADLGASPAKVLVTIFDDESAIFVRTSSAGPKPFMAMNS